MASKYWTPKDARVHDKSQDRSLGSNRFPGTIVILAFPDGLRQQGKPGYSREVPIWEASALGRPAWIPVAGFGSRLHSGAGAP
jgi:hypothetical protein